MLEPTKSCLQHALVAFLCTSSAVSIRLIPEPSLTRDRLVREELSRSRSLRSDDSISVGCFRPWNAQGYETRRLTIAVEMLNTSLVLVRSPSPFNTYLGMVSDMGLLSWFSAYAERTSTFQSYIASSLHSLTLPTLHMYTSVVATSSTSQVLDVMRLMSEQGVSSVAVLDEASGTLLSTVTVTDVGKVWISTYSQLFSSISISYYQIVVPTQSNHILSTPVQQFIAQIKVRTLTSDSALTLTPA